MNEVYIFQILWLDDMYGVCDDLTIYNVDSVNVCTAVVVGSTNRIYATNVWTIQLTKHFIGILFKPHSQKELVVFHCVCLSVRICIHTIRTIQLLSMKSLFCEIFIVWPFFVVCIYNEGL